MENFWFYVRIGLEHVLDIQAYDHLLFLVALGIPFTFKDWRQVVWLVTVFTVAHCLSLAGAVFGWIEIESSLVEFLIPLTIAVTALINLISFLAPNRNFRVVHLVLTGFFGLIHGLGFSNYFKILMAGEEEHITPLFGFATGIELSQLIVITGILGFSGLVTSWFRLNKVYYIIAASTIIILITIPLMVNAFPK